MSARRVVAAATVALLAMALGTSRRATAQQFQVKAGVTVAPDSVRVGDPFRVTVGIHAPPGATIEFPRTTDSSSAVQSIDPVSVRTSGDTTGVEQYADYRVAAWDVGPQPVRLPDAIVRLNGVERHVRLASTVFVRSVLPADTAQRQPKPQRDIFDLTPFPWWLLAAILAALIIIGLLVWWWTHRRRRPPPMVVVDPFEEAVAEFQRIEALGLLEAGERGRYVTLMIEVVRDYLAARYTEANLSLTSTELQYTARALPHVPADRLTRLLTDADLIKFARRPVSSDRSREIGREARIVVNEEHKASRLIPAEAAA
jgi:hypothetical protein